MWRRVFLTIYLMLASVRISSGAEANDVVVLPKFVVEADRIAFSLSWRCKGSTQKSKITRAWFADVPSRGPVERAGIRRDDRLLQYDGVILSDMTGDWLSERLKQPWKHGEVHELLIERTGEKLKFTVELKKPNQRSERNAGAASSSTSTPTPGVAYP
jgi:predicted metalloprotease with PDZ domain